MAILPKMGEPILLPFGHVRGGAGGGGKMDSLCQIPLNTARLPPRLMT